MRQIKGYENYFVDESGNVFRKLKPSWKKDTQRTYKQIVLSENGNVQTKQIHRLVAETFLENPNNYSTVHHINGDKLDNRVENLEWIDEKDHRAHHVAMGECRVNNFKECCLYKSEELIGEFKSVAEACRYVSEKYKISYYQLSKKREYKGFKIIVK